MKRIYILLASMMMTCSAVAMENAIKEAEKTLLNKLNPQPTLWQKTQEIFKPGADAFVHGVEFAKEFARDVATYKAPEAYQSFMDLDPIKKTAIVAGVLVAGYILVKTVRYCFSADEKPNPEIIVL